VTIDEEKGIYFVRCCCTCRHHLPVMRHCITEPELRKKIGCCCSVQKGWACVPPGSGRVYDNWPEHSDGCELHQPKEEAVVETTKQKGGAVA